MTTTSVAPNLPAGWLWEFAEENKRWGFIHVETEHKQTNFPNAGDELPASDAKDVPSMGIDAEDEQPQETSSGDELPASKAKDVLPDPPAYSTLEPIATLSTLSTTSVIAVQETNTYNGVSQLTASVASITVEPTLGPKLKAVRNLRRKPIGNSSPIAASVSHIGEGSLGELPNTRSLSGEQFMKDATQAEPPTPQFFDQPTTNPPSVEEKPVPCPQEKVEIPAHTGHESMRHPSVPAAVNGMQAFTPLQPSPTMGSMRHSSMPSVLHGAHPSTPLQPLQSPQAMGNTHRPSVSTSPNGIHPFSASQPLQSPQAVGSAPRPSVSIAPNGVQSFATPLQQVQSPQAVDNTFRPSVSMTPNGTHPIPPSQPQQSPQATGNTPRPSVSTTPNGLQSFVPLQQVQTENAPQPDRPNLSTIQSAPDVMQVDLNHTAGTISKRSRLSKMSKGVGDWAKKHPKMAIVSAVGVEIAGLAAGVDLAKDAQALRRVKQTVKHGMGVRPTNSLSAGTTPANKPAQQAAQQATSHSVQQQTQQQIQQQIQQGAHRQTQQLLQQLLQQQAAAGQPLQFQSGAPGTFGPANNLWGQFQNAQTGSTVHQQPQQRPLVQAQQNFARPGVMQQQQRPPTQMQQGFGNPSGNNGNGGFPSGQGQISTGQQQQQPAQMQQSSVNPSSVSNNPIPSGQASPGVTQQQPQPPVQTQQSFASPAANVGNNASSSGQASPGPTQQQQQPQQSSQAQQGFANPAVNVGNDTSQGGGAGPCNPGVAQQTVMDQSQSGGRLDGLVNHLADAYQNHQADQAAQQQAQQIQAMYQPQQTSNGMGDLLANMYQNSQAQQQTAYLQQPQQTSSGLGDLANNLATMYQNNQASQQQAAYQEQISEQQIAYIQQQSAAQQQATQAQIAQLNQQASMFQNPYAVQQQPVYIDNSGDGSGGLADALALATMMDSSSTSDPAYGVTTSDQGYVPDSSYVVDPSVATYSVDPMAEQMMVEEEAYQADSLAWQTIGEENALELI